MSTEKDTVKKATEEKKKTTATPAEVEAVKVPVKEETNQIADAGKTVDEQKQEKEIEQVQLPTDQQIIDIGNSYLRSIKDYHTETGNFPDSDLFVSQIEEATLKAKEEKEIAEMKRLEEIEANKPKLITVTNGKEEIEVTELTFSLLGKEWKRAPKEPKEVQELKANKKDEDKS